MTVKTGLDRVALADVEVLPLIVGRRIGLLAHAASVDTRLRPATRVLEDAGARIEAFFAPEHGFFGEAQDMVGVDHTTEQGRPVYSLYGATEDDLRPKRAWLDGLDAVVIDLQDVGSRYYTFVWSAAWMLREAAACGVQTIVLDRPNPLGGVRVEGAPQRPGFRSFVGMYDVAVRHGMTIGELCKLVVKAERLDSEALVVVRANGLRRSMEWEETGLVWVPPSPNMPTVDTARVYPGGCLLEGTNLSEGRGTTRPFETWGAPFLDAKSLAAASSVSGATLRPTAFQPMFHKHAHIRCYGVFVHVTDRQAFNPYAAYLQWIAEAARRSQGSFAFRTEPYEFVTDRPAIDLLTGGPEFRTVVTSESALADLLAAEQRGAARFEEQRKPFLLYE